MTGAQYIVDQLINHKVTDAFGIPGGVILELLYAFDKRRDEIMPHLSYHEQAAGFAACGYAQISGKIGVAYATRGPGFTNLITAIADAYYDMGNPGCRKPPDKRFLRKRQLHRARY